MTESAIVELGGVTHRYGDHLALDRLDLSIPAGCMAGLIGPDGVGKSTLLALAAGVRRIQTGRVTALSGDMADAGHRRMSAPRIAYMPQGLGRNLYPTLTVAENLDFFGRLFGHSAAERSRRSGELLAATGLAPFTGRPAGKLSGRSKQKLALCCALMHDQDLLILDGIPRTVEQSKLMDDHIDVFKVIHLSCDDEKEMFKRLRRRALKSNRVDDADEDVIRNRWKVYEKETFPVLEHYPKENIVSIDSLGSPARILHDILETVVPIQNKHFEAFAG